ncbi:MAG: 16S rRNA (uracil(1498)-N(3))-methyltransferase, partial [Myxococcota bacterium]
MNLVVLLEEDFTEETGQVRLSGRRHHHLLEIQRVNVGSELRVGQLNGLLGRGRVTALGSDFVELEISLREEPPPPLPLTLVLALPRPPVLRRVLITATSMGVKEVILLAARAVEKS